MKIKVSITRGKIIIKMPGLEAKETIKKIPGVKWKGYPGFYWHCDASPSAAGILAQECASDGFEFEVLEKGREEFWKLHAQYLERDTAALYLAMHDHQLPLPEFVKTKPWLHQLRGYHYYRSLNAGMIPFDMGTGKTKLAIDLMCNANDGAPVKCLIVAPRYVVSVWPKELPIHASIPYIVAAPEKPLTVQKRIAFLENHETLSEVRGESFFAVVNYESCLNEKMQRYLMKRKWDVIALDESHRAKSPTGRQARFIRTKLRLAGKKRYTLTGTPAPHSPLDVWSQFYFLDPAIYGTSFAKFRARYSECDQFNKPYEWLRQDEFNRLFYSIAYRVRAQDVLTLPDKQVVNLHCDLEPATRRIYNEMKQQMIVEIEEGTLTAANAAVKLLRLLQITSGFIPTDEGTMTKVSEAKAELLGQLMDDLGPDEPLVVFGVFHTDMDTIKRVAESRGRSVGEMSGRTKRDQVDAWMNGELNVLAAQIRSASLGVDFTRARYAAYFCPGYSAGDYDQSERRIWRPGQEKKVTYFRLMVRNTADVGAYLAIDRKMDIVEAVLGRRLN